MNYHFTSKRIHSPTDDYNNNNKNNSNATTFIPGQLPARKKVITDDLFTNKMAGLSLAHSIDTDTNQMPLNTYNTISNNNNNNSNSSGSGWRTDLVERVDDIDEYLDNDGNGDGTLQDDDTYLGSAPEILPVVVGTTILPFERIPGSTGLRIPDFISRSGSDHGDDDDNGVYESVMKQLHQYQHQHQHQTMPTDHDHQPMDLD